MFNENFYRLKAEMDVLKSEKIEFLKEFRELENAHFLEDHSLHTDSNELELAEKPVFNELIRKVKNL
jgi:hypothetical protein